MTGAPRIWVHAVSVGEVTAAAPIVAALRSRFPGACIVLSTSTETGQEMARKLVPAASAHIYYPLDIPRVVRKVIDRVNPDIFVPVETELWPNFIRICRERGTRIVMANGRISPRSFRRYRATRFFWKGVLAALDEAGVISATDAERLAAIGMPAERIHILGNAKYDGLAARVSPATRTGDRRPSGDRAGRGGAGRREHARGGGGRHPGGLPAAPGAQAGLQADPHPPPHRAGSGLRGAGPSGGICRLHHDVGDPGRSAAAGRSGSSSSM